MVLGVFSDHLSSADAVASRPVQGPGRYICRWRTLSVFLCHTAMAAARNVRSMPAGERRSVRSVWSGQTGTACVTLQLLGLLSLVEDDAAAVPSVCRGQQLKVAKSTSPLVHGQKYQLFSFSLSFFSRSPRPSVQVLNALSHMNDNAAGVPGRELGKQIYGRDSVFARNPTPAQVGPSLSTVLANLFLGQR